MLGKFNGPENIGRIRKEDIGVKKESERKFIEALIKDFVEFAINDEYYLNLKTKKRKLDFFSFDNETIYDLFLRYKKNKKLTKKEEIIIDEMTSFLKNQKHRFSELNLYFYEIFRFYDKEEHKKFLEEEVNRISRSSFMSTPLIPLVLGRYILKNNPSIVFLTARSAIPHGIIYREWAKNVRNELNSHNNNYLANKIYTPIFKLADAKVGRIFADYANYKKYMTDYYKDHKLEVEFFMKIRYLLFDQEFRNKFLTQKNDFLLKLIRKILNDVSDFIGNSVDSLTSDNELEKYINIIKKECIFIEKAIERYAKKLDFIKNFIKKGKFKEPIKITIFDEFVVSSFTLYATENIIREAAKKIGIVVEITHCYYSYKDYGPPPYETSTRPISSIDLEDKVIRRNIFNKNEPYFLHVIDLFVKNIRFELLREVGREFAKKSISRIEEFSDSIKRL